MFTSHDFGLSLIRRLIVLTVLFVAAALLPRPASAQMSLSGSVSPKPVSYIGTVTYSASASGGDAATTQYAFFRRRPGGTWIPSVSSPNWQSSGTFRWYPTINDVGTWETYIWAKDGNTPSTQNTYGYAAGYNTMPVDVIGPPTAPGPTTVSCDYTGGGQCWVTGDFVASVSASTGGLGSLSYQICRSNDTTGWGGCDVNLTLTGGTSITVSGSHLPSDGYQRAYYFQSRDSAGAYSGWSSPKFVRVDRYAPSVSASNASSLWYSNRIATLSASDSGSGVQSVRYSWNSPHNASCTTGTATSSGATLTAPAGDNLLYLCAKDNTGRVGQWSGSYRVSPLGLTGSVSPTQGSYLGSFTYTASASGGTPSTTRYAFFRRRPGGTWIPDVNNPPWQSGNVYTWTPTSSDTGSWETYIWVKDGDTPAGMNGYGYAAGLNTGPITVLGPPTVPGPTTTSCAYTASGECWVQGDFTASVTASTGGSGTLVYQICRSNDTTGFGGCDVNLTLTGGTSILVSGTHLPSDGYRRAYYFQAKDSAGSYSGWNTPLYVRVDRYAPSVSATNASDVDWYSSRTATVSASDAHSGVQSVRYSWNAALDAGCTTGTATSSGATLTAPVGDNTLYLCAKDNTGRVGQWSGRYRVSAPLSLACSISPASGSYAGGFTYTATVSGGIPSTIQYAFFHRIPGGTWVPAVTAPQWQASSQYRWMPSSSEAGTWETYVWVKDRDTPANMNTYGYAAGCNPGPITVVGPPTVPGPTTVACAYTASGECWVQGDFTASVTASTGGTGGIVYQICRSNDTTGFGGCDVNLTLTGGTSILVSGTNLPSDGYRRAFYFQAKDSGGGLSGWNTPLYVRADRYAPTVSATNASDTVWYSYRTATVAASDAHSGVQSVRYSWNTALDAGCTTGTATSAGAALTAPSGDNVLYLCAKDNTGRVGQWSGRYRVSALTLTGTVSPKPASYQSTVTYTATATGGTPSTTQYAFFRRQGGGAWIPDVSTPNWQSSPTFTWNPGLSAVGTWETYVWVKDGDTPATMNTHGYAAGFNTGPVDIVGKPTVPGPTTVSCAYATAEDCWVQGDFTASVTASTGGMGSLVYQICRSNDSTGGFAGCDVNLTLTGGTSILVSGAHLPADGYRRAYYFQAQDSAGVYSGWNTPRYVRVDRYAPTVSASNASDSWVRSQTAVVSASDSGTGGSGLAAIRYNWNTALDAACTSGTATSSGSTLTAPAGDNTLYLCAKDNTGRVAQWNGRYKVAASPTITVTPSPAKSSYLTTLTWTVTVTGGVPGTQQYAFVRRKLPDGAWIPDVNNPNWQTANTFSWKPEEVDAGSWSFFFAVKDSLTTPTDNTYGYASGVGSGPVEIVGRPTVPGPTTLTCNYSSPAGECWVWGEEDVAASVTPSTGGMGSLVYQICRSNDSPGGFAGCDVNLTLNGGTSIVIPTGDLPADGFRRAYWFQAKDSAGALSGWNTPAYLRVDRLSPWSSATNASEDWFTSRTATVSAGDDDVQASFNSGLRELRYAWNADACLGGTVVAPGTTLTVPPGDNLLYLCAWDNVGWNGGWSGRYRVRVVPAPAVASVSPKVIRQGTETVLTVTGSNLQGATVSIGAEPLEDGDPNQVFPTAELLAVDPSGMSLTVRIDASEPGIKGFYNLAVVTEGGNAAAQLRVVGTAPVVDVYTPSQPVQGNIHFLMVAGENLQGAEVVPLDPGIKVLDLDNSDDKALLGLLYVSSDSPTGQYDIRVQRPGGEYLTLSLNVVGSAAAASVATTELDVPGRPLRPDVPNVYLQEPVSPEGSAVRRMAAAGEDGGIESRTASGISICGGLQVSDEIWERSAILLSLSNELGDPLTREALNRLAPGERINFNSLTIAGYAWLRYRFFFRWCSGGYTRVGFCVGGGVYYMVPYVGGHGYEFDLCYGNEGGSFQLTPNGRITRHVWSTSGSCLDVEDADPESPSGERSGEIVAHCCDPTDISLQTSGTVWNSEFDAGGKVIEVRPENCTDPGECSKKIEWRYVKEDGTEGPAITGPVQLFTTPDQRQARVNVEFQPAGGSFPEGNVWAGGETLVTRSAEGTTGSTAQVTVTVAPDPGPGSATLTSPLYKWEALECTAEVAVRIATAEVQVNLTPDDNDDLVELTVSGTGRRTKARVRLPGSSPNDVAVVITNPDGRLRFPGPGDTTKTLTLPMNGDWVEFEISGELGSDAKDDAVIEVHQGTAEGESLGREAATVFYFDPSEIRVTRGSDYQLSYGGGFATFNAGSGVGVTFEAEATLKPSGLNCSAPPLRDLRIGFVQNATADTYLYYTLPTLTCAPGNSGKSRAVPLVRARRTLIQDYTFDSTLQSDRPLYQQVVQAVAIPVGCPGGGVARSDDTPTTRASLTATVPVPEGTANYDFQKATVNYAFRIWSVSYDTRTGTVVPLRESEWYLRAASDGASPQGATVLSIDRIPLYSPLISGAWFNDELLCNQAGDPGCHNVSDLAGQDMITLRCP